LGFAFDRHHARNELQAATFRVRERSKVRLLLSPTGAVSVEIRALEPLPAGPVTVALAPRPVPADDFRLVHKTSDRAFYDEPRRASGAFELLFTDEAGFLTEGSFTRLFVARARGLLPGILRERLIEEGGAAEADLVAADLAGGFFLGNALRGLIPARLAPEDEAGRR
jgi:para-aminobenzoate synthetase/4-amino-4-deoxychorismate lyase